jgi:hypothetical protein
LIVGLLKSQVTRHKAQAFVVGLWIVPCAL